MMRNAGVAQLVERFIRNEKVGGSIPFSGTTASIVNKTVASLLSMHKKCSSHEKI